MENPPFWWFITYLRDVSNLLLLGWNNPLILSTSRTSQYGAINPANSETQHAWLNCLISFGDGAPYPLLQKGFMMIGTLWESYWTNQSIEFSQLKSNIDIQNDAMFERRYIFQTIIFGIYMLDFGGVGMCRWCFFNSFLINNSPGLKRGRWSHCWQVSFKRAWLNTTYPPWNQHGTWRLIARRLLSSRDG